MRSILVACCAITLLLASCTSDGDSTGGAAPITTARQVATAAPSSATKLVKGKDYDVVATLPGEIDGAQAHWRGVDEAGTAYGEIDVPDPTADLGRMGLSSYSQPVLVSPTGELTRMTPVRDSGTRTQLTGGDANAEWVTWLETESTNVGAGQWRLLSYERATGKVRKLGSYRDRRAWKDTGLDYDGRPEIVGDDVLMGMTAWGRTGKGSAVLSAPLDGSAPLDVLVPEASAPDADEDGFSYVQLDQTLMYRDASTGKTRELNSGIVQGECQFYRSDVLVTCEKTADGVEVRVAGPDGEARFGPFRGGVSYVELRAGWVRFVEDADGDPQIYAVDVAAGALHHASASQGDWRLMGNGYALIVQRSAGEKPSGFQLIKLR